MDQSFNAWTFHKHPKHNTMGDKNGTYHCGATQTDLALLFFWFKFHSRASIMQALMNIWSKGCFKKSIKEWPRSKRLISGRSNDSSASRKEKLSSIRIVGPYNRYSDSKRIKGVYDRTLKQVQLGYRKGKFPIGGNAKVKGSGTCKNSMKFLKWKNIPDVK